MINVLYIGNYLSNDRSNVSGIHTLGALLQSEGCQVYYSSSKTNKVLRLLDMIWSCLKYGKKVDVVLIDTYSTLNFYYAYCISSICKWMGVDYIPILHGGNLPERLKKSPRMAGSIFNNSKYNVSPSNFLREVFISHGFKNTICIPNSIPLSGYPMIQKDYDIPKLLWVRSFSKIYNPELAVRVVHDLASKYPDVELCMVGPEVDGSMQATKDLANQLNVSVKFTGKLKKSEWIELSKTYNFFINTTNYDNMPVSLIEAMALGFPIISTEVGGIPYLIQDSIDGVLVAPNNASEMSLAIQNLFNNSEKRETIIANSRKKAENFDWSQIKSLWLDLLRNK